MLRIERPGLPLPFDREELSSLCPVGTVASKYSQSDGLVKLTPLREQKNVLETTHGALDIAGIPENIYSEKKHEATNRLSSQSLKNIQIDKQHTLFTYSVSDKEASSSLLQETRSFDKENTNILPEIICNSPKSTRNKTLCNEIEMLRKRVEVLQRKIKQKNKRISALSNISRKETNAKSSVCNKAINTSPSLLHTMKKSTEDKETSISPKKLWNSPTKHAIREENKKQKLYLSGKGYCSVCVSTNVF
ncbi:PREDICTED: uncharacterized protein LOC105449461 [Wasmannia auropunctata]|uniref:uncharacterized protein LOC105449461 n=1 Tax=Wasmannia auropunctata TaxID=64793 RepID=UPI0005EDC35D|nr:PREDICTED: uncharacterized protein LOC105449461 [Wasmannia auropunctata]